MASSFYGTDGHDNIEVSRKAQLYGGDGADVLTVNGPANQIVHGEGGDDVINAIGHGHRYLSGGDGNDDINIDTGVNLVDGGRGNDNIEGGWNQDVYLFNIGDGTDTIYDKGGVNDRILFGPDITPENIRVRQIGNDLHLSRLTDSDAVTSDSIRIVNYFSGRAIEQITFYNGTSIGIDVVNNSIELGERFISLSQAQVNALFNSINEANQAHIDDVDAAEAARIEQYILTHGEEAEVPTVPLVYPDLRQLPNISAATYGSVDNSQGIDNVNVHQGTLTSIQRFYTGQGFDIFFFEKGDGHDEITDDGGYDIIQFGDGIAPENLIIKQDSENVRITFNHSNDNILIKADQFIEALIFKDGTLLRTFLIS